MTDDLANTMRSLHDFLAANPRLDPGTLRSLESLAGEIQQIVDQQRQPLAEESSKADAEAPLQGEPEGTLSGRIQEFIEEVEAHHPQLTRTLSMIAERLADMGI